MTARYASVADLNAVIRHTLLASNDLTEVVGGRIYSSHMQQPDTRTVVYPMVIVEVEGGRIGSQGSYQGQILYIYAYSTDSQGEANRIYDIAHRVLHHQTIRRDGVPIAGYCIETNRPHGGWNLAARAYFTRGLWMARTVYREGQT